MTNGSDESARLSRLPPRGADLESTASGSGSSENAKEMLRTVVLSGTVAFQSWKAASNTSTEFLKVIVYVACLTE